MKSSSLVQSLTSPLKSIRINDSIEEHAVREAETEINQAFETLLTGFRHQVLTVLMRTTQTILQHRLQVTTSPVAVTPTIVAVTPTASLTANNGRWRKSLAKPKPTIKPIKRLGASQDQKEELQSILIMIRSSMNWSQAELAQRVDVSPLTVGHWERGRSFPEEGTHQKILALGKETGVLPK